MNYFGVKYSFSILVKEHKTEQQDVRLTDNILNKTSRFLFDIVINEKTRIRKVS